MLKSLLRAPTPDRVRSAGLRISRPNGRPIVLPVALPTVPRFAILDSREAAAFSADRLVSLFGSIDLPIREGNSAFSERWFATDCFLVIETEGSFLPITVPMFRLRSVRAEERPLLLIILDEVDVLVLLEIEDLVELTAGCLAPVGAEELRVPIVLPIRERWLVVGCFFAFERDGVLRLLEPPIREAPLERAAGCLAPLGTDGLVVLIVLREESIGLPIRELILGLIRLLVLVRLLVLIVGLFVILVRDLLLDWLVLLLIEEERLPVVVLALIELPIREVMLELMRPFELVLGEVEELLTGRLTVLRLLELLRLDVLVLGALLVMDLLLDWLLFILSEVEGLLGVRLVMDLLELLLLGVRLVIDLLEALLVGVRLVMALLEVLLLGVRLVMALLDVLLVGVRLVMALLEVLLLGVRLVMALLDVLLLGVRLAVTRLELRLDAMLLELLDEDDLDVALGAGAGLEACRVCLLELLDLLLLDRFVAAKTGSQNNKRANKMQKTKTRELSRRDSPILIFNL